MRWHPKRFEQSHLLVAFEGPSAREDAFFTAQVFSGLFGGGMSSRLFQEAREKRGLCYAIYSSAWGLTDTGMLAVHAATGTEMMAELIDVVGTELASVAEKGPTPAELARAKAQLKAGLLMALESSSARAEQMARQLLNFGRLIEAEELIEKVDAVTVADARDFAAELGAIRPSIAVVGAGKRSRELGALAERTTARASAGAGTWRS
jgi:predicted Zn-dependent peptidase